MSRKLIILIFILAAAPFFSGLIHNSLFRIQTVLAIVSTNIDSTYHFAWNDLIGWIDFYATNNVNINSAQIRGYASSSVGYIALNCNSTPNGDICDGPAGNWKVSNDGNGNLSGWAWNDAIGWISFSCSNSGTNGCTPPGVSYQVTINPTTGNFSGWAWNDNIGWISFSCYNLGTCSTSNYLVRTNWQATTQNGSLISSTFDTNATSGVALNTIMWQGTQPSGTTVQFQIASSNCPNGSNNPPKCNSGGWAYIGPDGSSATYYTPAGPGVPAQINLAQNNNVRYFRYEIFLYSDAAQTQSPTVKDVIINYSP